MFVPRGDRDLGVAYQTHPGNQASSRGEAKNSAILLGRDWYLLEPTVCPKGSQASCGVWIEDSGFLSRPCRKRRPSSRNDGGVSWVFSSCSASVGFLMRYYGELREPLLWRQGSQVSMRVSRGSASLLSSHGRGSGQGPHLAMTGEPRGVSGVVAGFSSFDREYSLPHVLAQGSPIFHSSC